MEHRRTVMLEDFTAFVNGKNRTAFFRKQSLTLEDGQILIGNWCSMLTKHTGTIQIKFKHSVSHTATLLLSSKRSYGTQSVVWVLIKIITDKLN